ncbi:MAG: NUDIX domain-containing protein [Rhodospirillales bacterium]|nr:NUDIX domain-containing protein [Rhodospirillales bacterium]MCW8861075.1 NUDIX domain-containing protein [Rhodospirillales bacterium]MCW8952409.1 NUDIX domain-containing protein [Rhodospirillales bacterium]MCW8969746.1 NUDIX domain-containing protein [Rhodospirillales bacterium]MCW9002981.1 NUDIX domain-containing protein [Rhodospirillales bacterium]
MDANDVEITETKRGYDGFFGLDRYVLRHRLYEGGWSKPMSREVLERGHAVAVVLFDPDLDSFVLIEQFRIGAYAAGWNPWLIEIVAGIIDKGESPEAVALRESLEETGCEALDPVFLCRFLASSGCTSETVEVFAARVDASNAGGIHGLDHEDEDIRVLVVPSDEVWEWLDSNKINNSAAIIGLEKFRARQQELITFWGRAPSENG